MTEKVILLPILEAVRIRYILKVLLSYIEEVGPRDLRSHKEEVEQYISILPDNIEAFEIKSV
jgi:hypothetical protein